ncbi:EAL domain-containing protein [Gorillibacterium sp. sgz5001074]|uniref:EAL domain-containing protein n=1 Tax=Gorillibacterium sp. sgz5001074 TaxID=3446695 RepID=UPI003F661BBB
MRGETNRGTWTRRLRKLSRLIYPDRMLQYFPPDFIFRDPVLRMVKRIRRDGGQSALLLFHIEDYHVVMKNKSTELIRTMQSLLQTCFLETAFAYITQRNIIGIKQYQTNEIVLFVRIEDVEDFGRCAVIAGKICEELETRLEKLFSLHTDTPLKIKTGSTLIENHPDPDFAVDAAYHYAMAKAAKDLPAHFAMQNLQFEEILQTEDLTVLTQPIMDLKSGEIFGWEVLTRGPKNSPFHNPEALFEFADQAEALPDLEWVVIQKALREIVERQIKEQVFINITPVSLSDPKLLGKLLELLRVLNLDSSQLIFEITERHSIRDFEQMASILRSYRAQGFRFAVDDAGSGYSSLQSMSELIPDIIKIDKSVIRNIDREAVKQAMLRSLLYFAENINCTVIAEGVEREEEANILLQNHVHMGQGYYFAKPQPFEHGRNIVHFATLKEKIIHMRKQAANL